MARRSRRKSKPDRFVPKTTRHDLLTYMPRGTSMPFAPRYRTRMFLEAEYKIPTSTASITTGYIKLNSLTFPLWPGGSTAFPSFTYLGPLTEASLSPTGFQTLCSTTLYRDYRVINAEIRLKISGATTSNNCYVTILPSANSAAPIDIYRARTQPLVRNAFFNASKENEGTDRQGFLVNRRSIAQIQGVPEGAIQFDSDYQAAVTLDPTQLLGWYIYVQNVDSDVSGTTASTVQVRLAWDVEFFGITQGELKT
jgi:hypothetical protein